MSEIPFEPDWASPPGETLRDLQTVLGISGAEVARQLEMTSEQLQRLRSGSIPILYDTATKLASMFGTRPDFWLRRESQYRVALTRLLERSKPDVARQQWVEALPVADMVRFGWIDAKKAKANKIGACLEFFAAENVTQWQNQYSRLLAQAAFRISHSFNSQQGAVAAWLREAEIRAASMSCRRWDAHSFEASLPIIRKLTRKADPKDFIPTLLDICAKNGVALVTLRTPKGCPASGAARFIEPERAMIVLSLRHFSDDQFWFTFFHEAAHLLLHGDAEAFVDGLDEASDGCEGQEQEANRFALNQLVPPEHQHELDIVTLEHRSIIRLAMRLGVSPGIIAGQLHHRGRVPQNHFRGLVRNFNKAELEACNLI